MAFEIHIVVDAPTVCDAVNNLAAALRTKFEIPNVDKAELKGTAPVATPIQTDAPTNQTADIQPSVQPAPAPAPAEHQYTVDEISRAGAALLDQPGKMGQLVTLLGKYGVPSIVNLNPYQYAAFAADLRTLGAKI